ECVPVPLKGRDQRVWLYTPTTVSEYRIRGGRVIEQRGTFAHGVTLGGRPVCPMVRFAQDVDLEGRATGVVWPLIPIQNRGNHTVFDLLVAQTYGSFQDRTISGMAPAV